MEGWNLAVSIIGILFGSAAVADWLKRRNRREGIKGDLDVWQKLPDGSAKDRLLSRIESRVEDLGVLPSDTRRRWVNGAIGGWVGLTIVTAAQFIGGSYSFERHSDGILWVHTLQGPYLPFATAVLWYLGGPILVGWLMAKGAQYTVGDLINGVKQWFSKAEPPQKIDIQSDSEPPHLQQP